MGIPKPFVCLRVSVGKAQLCQTKGFFHILVQPLLGNKLHKYLCTTA